MKTKKILSIVLSLVMILTAFPLTAVNSFAKVEINDDSWYEKDGYYYTARDDGAVYIAGSIEREESTIIIPSEVEGYTVSGLRFSWGDCCFPNAERIILPDTITFIGQAVFCGCTKLKDITIPESVTYIGNNAFSSCESLERINIPDSVTYIDMFAFACCTSLTSITIPKSVTDIGEKAFGYYTYDINEETSKLEKVDGFTIYGYEGTEAERYANENGFTFIALEKEPIVEPTPDDPTPNPNPDEPIQTPDDPTPTPEVPADVSGDGKLSVVDAKWILQAVANARALTDEQRSIADVNGDGKVTVVDAKWILQAVAGMRVL